MVLVYVWVCANNLGNRAKSWLVACFRRAKTGAVAIKGDRLEKFASRFSVYGLGKEEGWVRGGAVFSIVMIIVILRNCSRMKWKLHQELSINM